MRPPALATYLALGLCAIAGAVAVPGPARADMAAIAEMREGDMQKLIVHDTAKPVSAESFLRETEGEGYLSDYAGKYVVVNFWATWCPPCRKEMPMLSALQRDLGGERFEVVTLATGRNSPVGMRKFFEEIGVDNLPLHRDPRGAIARDMGVFGLPVTVILSPEGEEIARLTGEADWASEPARALIRALIAAPAGG